eukprot:3183404-Prorocentrum_lima.AAC.1
MHMLANGRLVMMAISGMFFHGFAGPAWGDWAMSSASPLHGCACELGVQAVVGAFDPAGFS